MIGCGLNRTAQNLPDAGQGMCCWGAIVYGPQRYKADGTPANLCAGWLLRCAKEVPR